MSTADNKVPNLASLGLIALGLVIAAIGGLTSGSIAGGLIAACGIFPAMWGMWTGMQQKTQGALGVAILLFILSLGVGGLLILLRFVDWLR